MSIQNMKDRGGNNGREICNDFGTYILEVFQSKVIGAILDYVASRKHHGLHGSFRKLLSG